MRILELLLCCVTVYAASNENSLLLKWQRISNDQQELHGELNQASVSYIPSARSNANYASDSLNRVLYLFGGYSFDDHMNLNDLWSFNVAASEWVWFGNGTGVGGGSYVGHGLEGWPAARDSAVMHYDQTDNSLILFGGNYEENSLGCFWRYSIAANQFIWVDGYRFLEGSVELLPSRRSNALTLMDENNRKVYLFGGVIKSGPDPISMADNILWCYDLVSKSWNVTANFTDDFPSGGLPIEGSVAVFDYAENTIVFLLGSRMIAFNEVLNENRYEQTMWKLNLDTLSWEVRPIRHADSPSRRGMLSYHQYRNDVFMFGGVGDELLNELFLYNLHQNDWSSLKNEDHSRSPEARFGAVAFYDDETRQFFLFGGTSYGQRSRNDFWKIQVENVFDKNETISTTATTFTRRATHETNSIHFSRLDVSSIIEPRNDDPISAPMLAAVIVVSTILLFVTLSLGFTLYVRARRIHLKKLRRDIEKAERNASKKSNVFVELTEMPFSNSRDGTRTLFTVFEGLTIPGYREFTQIDFCIQDSDSIGRGNQGTIRLASSLNKDLAPLQSLMALKLVEKPLNQISESLKIAFDQEVSILWLLKDSNYIAKCLGFCYEPFAIILKYYPLGSLQQYLHGKDRPVFTKRILMALLQDIASGLAAIHEHEIVHCDIKSANILLEQGNNGDVHALITDFGVSQIVSTKTLVVNHFKVSLKRGFSYAYAAPEIFRYKNVPFMSIPDKKHDIYSLSILMIEMMTRSSPWST